MIIIFWYSDCNISAIDEHQRENDQKGEVHQEMAIRSTDQKKRWVRPEISVLMRSTSEEAVLAGCKNRGEGVGGPNHNFACTFTGYGNGETGGTFCHNKNDS
jgi:hypothetical protein